MTGRQMLVASAIPLTHSAFRSMSMSTKQYPTAEYLWQCFRYEDGKLFWIERPLSHFKNDRYRRAWIKGNAGAEAGCIVDNRGQNRCMITMKGKMYFRYRFIWIMHNGRPVAGGKEIDHINRNTLDDRIENLRECNRSENSWNASLSVKNKSGFRGVTWKPHAKKWRADICVKDKRIHLGYFKTVDEAVEARVKASNQMFGTFSNEEVGSNGNN